MELVFNHGHVDVDDIAIFQMFFVIRNAVAHHFIDRDTDRFRIPVVAEAGGDCFLFVDNIVVANAIQLAGGHARLDVRGDHFQHFSGQTASNAHFFNIFWSLNRNSHGICPSVSIFSTIIEY